ncbi:MAG: energy transducer TonB [Flavobacteriales bacterium]|nr:energy transducer TonB [Flavobacteriales bacterium]
MLTLLIITSALVFLAFFVDASWNNVLSSDRNELVFESRNRNYGAYRLRRDHSRTVLVSLFVSASVFSGTAIWMMKTGRVPEIVRFNDILQIVDPLLPPPVSPPPVTPSKPTAGGGQGARTSNDITHKTEFELTDAKPTIGPPDDPDDDLDGPAGHGTGTGIDPTGKGNGDTGSLFSSAPDSVYEFVKDMPQFPGGEAKMLEWLSSHMKPLEAPASGEVKGVVWVTFVVSYTGEVTDASLVSGIKGQKKINDKAVHVVSSMPTWTPGMMNGRPVNVRFRVPFHIHLR